MISRKLGLVPLAALALMMLQAGAGTEALAAACPAVTVAKDMGITGKYHSSSIWRSSRSWRTASCLSARTRRSAS